MHNIIHKQKHLIRNLNNCFKNFQSLKSTNYIPCTIKPNYLSIPRDVNVLEIISNINKDLKEQLSEKFYKELTQREKTRRRLFIDAIKNYIQINRINDTIIFPTIFLYDILIKNNNSSLNLEKLSLGALILSIKFNYCAGFRYTNKKFKNYNYNDYSSNDLNQIELICLSLINYNLHYIHPMIYLELFFINGIVFTTDNIKADDSNYVYKTTLIALEEVMKRSNSYIEYNPFFICCAIISYSRKKFNLEEWPNFLGKIFDISFNDFKETLDYVNDILNGFKINEKTFLDKNNTIGINQYSHRDNNNCYIKRHFTKIQIRNEEHKDKSERQNSSVINVFKNKLIENITQKLTANNSIDKSNFFNINPNNSNTSIINEEKINGNNYYLRKNEPSKKKNEIKTIYLNENSKNEDSFGYSLNNNLLRYNYRYIKEPNRLIYNNSEINKNINDMKKNVIVKNKNKLYSSQEIIYNNNQNFKKENIEKYDEKNIPKKIPSIEHYKKFNISLHNKLPFSLLERRVKNLSSVVNHLYSNHHNNIL